MNFTKIMIKNFKCINEASIELAPLTIFVGPNGSGKTSILEAIALFAQSNRRKLEEAVTREAFGTMTEEIKPLVNFEEINDIFYKRDLRNELSLGFEVELKEGELEEIMENLEGQRREWEEKARMDEKFSEGAKVFSEIVEKMKLGLEKNRRISYEYRMKRDEKELHTHILTIGNIKIECPMEKTTSETEVEGFPLEVDITGHAYFLPETIILSTKGQTVLNLMKVMEILRRRVGDIERDREIFYISANRGYFPWEYEGKEKNEVGVNGEYTIEVISKILAERDLKKISDFEFFCSLFGVKKPWSGWKRRRDILTSSYLDPFIGSPYNLKFPHLGYGSKQILPVITQIVKEEGKVILVEEPEISMHPEYQRRLPFLFAYAVSKGHQVIVTTHSSYFVLALGEAIQGEKLTPEKYGVTEEREIKLDPNNVIVYHVDRDREGVKIKKLEFAEDGFIKEGIPSFVNVERKLFERILR